MTHEEILKAARERLAEIDREKARLEDERGKLQALLGVQPTPQFVPVLPPMSPGIAWREQWRQVPEVTWTPHVDTFGTFTICTTDPRLSGGITIRGMDSGGFTLHDLSSDLVIGGEQGPNPSIRYTS